MKVTLPANLIHMQHGLDHPGFRLEPVGEFTDEIVVAGLMRKPRIGVNDAVLNKFGDAFKIRRQGIAACFDRQLGPVNGDVFETQFLGGNSHK